MLTFLRFIASKISLWRYIACLTSPPLNAFVIVPSQPIPAQTSHCTKPGNVHVKNKCRAIKLKSSTWSAVL